MAKNLLKIAPRYRQALLYLVVGAVVAAGTFLLLSALAFQLMN